MYHDLTLLSHAAGEEDFQFRRRDYNRRAGAAVLGPSPFVWNDRQRADLATLFQAQNAEGARRRIAVDLGQFLGGLGFQPNAEELDAADARGEEIVFTVCSEAPELYTLPWEITSTGASETYLADHPAVIVRHAWPGLPAREIARAPEMPGVLFAWSDAAGRVPHAQMGGILQAICKEAGVAYKEAPRFHGGTLQDILDETPLSVVHILCHGVAAARAGEPPRLGWGDGSQPPVAATQIARILRPYRDQVRLVVLSCCGSGDGSQDALFLGSVAQEIHRKGVPTVICSRSLLSIPGAVGLTRELYARMLRDGWSLERAARAARMKLFRADEAGETHESDAYALEVYTTAMERCPPGSGQGEERPVLSTYPFGAPAAPAPKAAPPRQTLTITPADTAEARKAQREALLAALRALGEDPAVALYDHPDKVPGVVPAPPASMHGHTQGDVKEAQRDEPPAVTEVQKAAEKQRIEAEKAAELAAAAAAAAAREAELAAAREAEARAAAEAERRAAEEEDSKRRAAELVEAERLAAERREAEEIAAKKAAEEERARAEAALLALAARAAAAEAAALAERERKAQQAAEREAARAAAAHAAAEAKAKAAAQRQAEQEAERLAAAAREAQAAAKARARAEVKARTAAEERLKAAENEKQSTARKKREAAVAAALAALYAAQARAGDALAQAAKARLTYDECRLRESALKSTRRTVSATGGSTLSQSGHVVAWVSVDGVQRLMDAWRDGRLEKGLGFRVASLQAHTPFIPTPPVAGPEGLGGFAPPSPAPPPPPTGLGVGAKVGLGVAGLGAVIAAAFLLQREPATPAPPAATTSAAVDTPAPASATPTAAVDADSDSFASDVDCDDADASVHPGAAEVPGNGKDDDCDPATPDESAAAPTTAARAPCKFDADGSVAWEYGTPLPSCITDADGDLWDAQGYCAYQAAEDPTYHWMKLGKPDCDDGDAKVHPMADPCSYRPWLEVPGNGKNDDCDDSTPDSGAATKLSCGGSDFNSGGEGTDVYEFRRRKWTLVGSERGAITCESDKLIATSWNNARWQYAGTPNAWTLLPPADAAKHLTCGGMGFYLPSGDTCLNRQTDSGWQSFTCTVTEIACVSDKLRITYASGKVEDYSPADGSSTEVDPTAAAATTSSTATPPTTGTTAAPAATGTTTSKTGAKTPTVRPTGTVKRPAKAGGSTGTTDSPAPP